MELKVDKSDVFGETSLNKNNDIKINIDILNQNCMPDKYFKKMILIKMVIIFIVVWYITLKKTKTNINFIENKFIDISKLL